MNKPATVDEAIAKGHRMVNYPVILIMIATPSICFFLGYKEILPWWIIPIGFLLAFGLAWLYWSIAITKWRLWAFENVRDVHQLKRRAIKEKLIWPDDSVFGKTEIRSTTELKQWNSLLDKFDQPDLFIDDRGIPDETIIYFSRSAIYIEMTIMLCSAAGGVYLMMEGNYWVGLILMLVGLYFSYEGYKKSGNKKPQIIISNEGIKTVNTDFYKWSQIRNEEATTTGYGSNSSSYLTYNYPGGTENLAIDKLDINHRKLEKLLIVYRGRSKARTGFH